jgi:phage gpG-like protein
MINVEIVGDEKVILALGEKGVRIEAAVVSTLNRWAAELVTYIKTVKLGGQPLKRRSGRLSGSVHPLATTVPGRVSAGAGAGAGVPYARIHELGGHIPAHVVVVRNALALSIKLPTGTIFRHSARIPQVTMPERSYMRSALSEKAPEGIAAIKATVKQELLR